MDKHTKALFEARALIVKAMAHPTRLFIVERLAQRAHCVCELTQLIGRDISTVSKHLTVLKNAGIIAAERRGLEIYYALRAPCILRFLSCIEGILRKNSKERSKLLA